MASRRSFLRSLGVGVAGLCALPDTGRADTGPGPGSPPASIDVHHHVVPAEYVQALAGMGITRSIGMAFPDWSAAQDLAMMDRLGVQAAVASISTPAANVPGQAAARALARRCNELLARLVADHPGRYGALATVPPLGDVEGATNEIAHALDTLKLDGVTLLTNYDQRYLGDPAFEEVYRALDVRRAVVHVHPTDPPGPQLGLPPAVMEVTFDTTRAATSLICSGTMERHPAITFILAHGGGTLPYLSYRIGAIVPMLWKSFRQNAPQGFEAYLGRFCYDSALVGPETLPFLVKRAGAAHVLAGTDMPFSAAVGATAFYQGLRGGELAETERRALARENALRLFPRLRRV
jgi:predicted TIM-barrel fold metal-dependent hydrolase